MRNSGFKVFSNSKSLLIKATSPFSASTYLLMTSDNMGRCSITARLASGKVLCRKAVDGELLEGSRH